MDGRWTVIFNGELFNYRELAAMVSATDPRRGDTQVLADTLAEFGPQRALQLADLEGAFLAWHQPTRTLVAARDHLGIKPLYWARLGTETVWASEIGALVAVGAEAVQVVPPGSVVRQPFDEPTSDPVLWWRAPTRSVSRRGNPAVLRRLLVDAVSARVPDGPVAVALSGGVDSSLILTLAVLEGHPVTAYTLATPTSPDLPHARRLCARLGVPLVEVEALPPDELTATLPRVVQLAETWEWHVLNHAAPMLPLVKALRRDGHRVCLTGEGADEVFIGYESLGTRANLDDVVSRRLSRLRDLHRTNCRRLDRIGMAYQIEFRVPFLAKPLLDEVLAWPMADLVSSGNKGLLRAVAMPHVGERIAGRAKKSLAKGVGYEYERGPTGEIQGGVFREWADGSAELPTSMSHLPRFPFEQASLAMLHESRLTRASYILRRSL